MRTTRFLVAPPPSDLEPWPPEDFARHQRELLTALDRATRATRALDASMRERDTAEFSAAWRGLTNIVTPSSHLLGEARTSGYDAVQLLRARRLLRAMEEGLRSAALWAATLLLHCAGR